MSVSLENEKQQELNHARTEAQYLRDFLQSPGFLAAKDLIDAEIREGTEAVLEYAVVDIATLVTHFQVIGEVNANKRFERNLRARLGELEGIIGDNKE